MNTKRVENYIGYGILAFSHSILPRTESSVPDPQFARTSKSRASDKKNMDNPAYFRSSQLSARLAHAVNKIVSMYTCLRIRSITVLTNLHRLYFLASAPRKTSL